MPEEDFNKQLTALGYVTIRGSRDGHEYLPDRKMLFVLFAADSSKINRTEEFRRTLGVIKPKSSENLIIVSTENQLSMHIRGALAVLKKAEPGLYTEAYHWDKFAINFPEHNSWCEQRICSAAEIERYRDFVKSDVKFKKILHTDTSSVWLGARPGDHVWFKIPSHTAGYAIDYRECI